MNNCTLETEKTKLNGSLIHNIKIGKCKPSVRDIMKKNGFYIDIKSYALS